MGSIVATEDQGTNVSQNKIKTNNQKASPIDKSDEINFNDSNVTKKQIQKQKDYDIEVIEVSNIALAIRNKQPTINVELSLRCESLPTVQSFGSAIDSMIVIFKKDQANQNNSQQKNNNNKKNFIEVGRTQIIFNCTNPKYIKTFIIPFNQEKDEELQFRIYHVNSPKSEDLKHQQLVGVASSKLDVLFDLENHDLQIETTTNYGEMLEVPNENTNVNKNKGHAMQQSTNPGAKKYNNKPLLKINCAEYDGGTSKYQIGIQLSNFNNVGRNEVFYVIQAWKFGEWVPIVRSESKRPSKFKEIQVNINKFQGEDNSGIRIKIYEAEKQSQIGSTNQFSISDIFFDDKVQTHRVEHSGFVVGTLFIYKWKKKIRDSFISYIVGGARLHLILAIDFTNSNSKCNFNTDTNSSLHTLDENGENAYINAMKQIVGVLQYFSHHNQVAFYGFGAKLPPYYRSVSQCFALNGNYFNPNVEGGVKELIRLYKENLKKIKLHGPTKISQILDLAIKYASEEQSMSSKSLTYYVLIIITDGKLNDYDDAVQLIIKASTLPLSILFVGIGDGGVQVSSKRDSSNQKNLFGILESLDDDVSLLKSAKTGESCERDIVDFIKISDFLHDTSKLSLARETFAEIPNHFIDYMSRKGIKPSKEKKSLKAAKAEFVAEKIKQSNQKTKTYVASFLINQRKQMRKKLIALGFNSKDPILDRINVANNDLNYFIEKQSLLINQPSQQFLEKQKEYDREHTTTISSHEIKKLQKYLEEKEKKNKQKTLEQLQKIQSNYYGYRLKLPKKLNPPRPPTPKQLVHPCILCSKEQIGILHLQCGHSSICVVCYQSNSNKYRRCMVCYHINSKVLNITKVINNKEKDDNSNSDSDDQYEVL